MTTAAIPKTPFHNRIKRSTVLEIISGLFIILFIYTSLNKLGNYDGFVSVLSRSPLIGSKAMTLGWTIPVLEILVSIILFFPRTRKLGLYSSFLLMTLFTGYIFYMLYFAGGDLPCSCGGVLNSLSWKQHLIFNIGWMLLGLVGILVARKQKSKSQID